MDQASAPGKVILCGEHAVVYGQPAIALPLPNIRATAAVAAAPPGSGVTFDLPDLGERWTLHETAARPIATQPDALHEIADHPLAMLLRLTLHEIGVATLPDLAITLRSEIPIAGGMGSGAALGAALVKAIALHEHVRLGPDVVARLVYESERFYHGTPSGIDNTVVSYEQALWFVRDPSGGAPVIEPVTIAEPLTLLIGDTGVRAPTRLTVGGVRERRLLDPARYEALFAAIGALVHQVRHLLATGDLAGLGAALDHNQALLHEIGVSSPELERLIAVARSAGALGAKLSGGGGGGIMLALVRDERREAVTEALFRAGATRVSTAIVTPGSVL